MAQIASIIFIGILYGIWKWLDSMQLPNTISILLVGLVVVCGSFWFYNKFNPSKKNGFTDTSLLGHALYYNNAFYKYIVDQHYFNLPGFEALCYKVYDDYDTEVKIRTHQDE